MKKYFKTLLLLNISLVMILGLFCVMIFLSILNFGDTQETIWLIVDKLYNHIKPIFILYEFIFIVGAYPLSRETVFR